jgi:Uma2 family endonuclease
MAATRVILTYKDYAALPADGKRYELHEGELSMTPAPGSRHQQVSRNLFALLHQHVTSKRLGEVLYAPLDCILSDTTIVQPDIVYLASEKRGLISARGIEGPPTLVVEILSPSTAQIDRATKMQLYARYGVPYYWIVEPEPVSIEAQALKGKEYQFVLRASGPDSLSLLPFRDLPLIPASLEP